MLMFGWQGATCIDEWTMAACNLAMGASLVLAGSGAFSVDNALLHRRPAMAHRRWFRWAAGALPLPLEARRFNALALAVLAAVAVFNVATYDHFRGSVYSAYHKGPVSPSADHYTLSEATVATDGSVHFHIYLDGGTADVPSHIAEVQLRGKDGAVLERWDMTALSTLSATAIQNDFAYNKFKIARFGLSAEMGSMATIDLPPRATLASSAQTLVAIDIDGRSFSTAISQVDAAPKT
jgi:thiosulfate dehydrogenase [quinone] large subunit